MQQLTASIKSKLSSLESNISRQEYLDMFRVSEKVTSEKYLKFNFSLEESYNSYQVIKKESFPSFFTFKKKFFAIPLALGDLIPLLEKAKMILTLEENWDDNEGKVISEETFLSMASFIINYANSIYRNFDYVIDKPTIYPSLEGSIDIDWEKDDYGLLINIGEGGTYASYYGDNKQKGQMVEGSFNPLDFNFNLLPLAISL